MTKRTTRKVLIDIIDTARNAERLRQKLYNTYREADRMKHAIVATHSRKRLSELNDRFGKAERDIKDIEDEIYYEERKLRKLLKKYEDLHEDILANLRLKLRRY